jgi:Rha family phage regulatory protein
MVPGMVFNRDGGTFTNSRAVAKFFKKRPDNVVRDIRLLISRGLLNFEETPYVDSQNGETYVSFDMDRDGFTMLGMGFNRGNATLTNSLGVAAFFGKTHGHVLRDIDDLISHGSDLSDGVSRHFTRVEVEHPTVAGRRRGAALTVRAGGIRGAS